MCSTDSIQQLFSQNLALLPGLGFVIPSAVLRSQVFISIQGREKAMGKVGWERWGVDLTGQWWGGAVPEIPDNLNLLQTAGRGDKE